MRNDLHDHMKECFENSLKKRNLELNKLTQHYVVSMLVDFSNITMLNNVNGLPTLALLYKDAIEANGSRKILAYRRLGDISLFLSGFFLEYVKKTNTGLGYYIDMGQCAYHSAFQLFPNPVFDEISRKFVHTVVALNNVAGQTLGKQSISYDDLIELFARDENIEFVKRKIQLNSYGLDLEH